MKQALIISLILNVTLVIFVIFAQIEKNNVLSDIEVEIDHILPETFSETEKEIIRKARPEISKHYSSPNDFVITQVTEEGERFRMQCIALENGLLPSYTIKVGNKERYIDNFGGNIDMRWFDVDSNGMLLH